MFFRQLVCSQDIDVIVNGNFIGVPMISALNYLETNYPVRFYYKEEWFARDTVKVRIDNLMIGDATRILLNGRPFTYRIVQGNQIVILPREEVAMLAGRGVMSNSNSGPPGPRRIRSPQFNFTGPKIR